MAIPGRANRPRMPSGAITLNSTSMARPPFTANCVTARDARTGGVKHQVKPICQPSVGVGHERLIDA
jgi:hypothetical protein